MRYQLGYRAHGIVKTDMTVVRCDELFGIEATVMSSESPKGTSPLIDAKERSEPILTMMPRGCRPPHLGKLFA